MSTLEVNKIIPQSGSDVQVGESGDTVTLPAGSVSNSELANSSITINGSSCFIRWFSNRTTNI